jgi:hypothetical protein
MSQNRRRVLAGTLLLPAAAGLGARIAHASGTVTPAVLPPVSLAGGWSETALTALTVDILDKHGITFGTAAPATPLTSQDGRLGVHYPIKAGYVALDLTSDSATFDGGITFSKDDTGLTFTELAIDLVMGTVSALPTVNTTVARRADVATFRILDATVTASAAGITLAGLTLRLTMAAVDGFHDAFGAAIFPVGHPYSDTTGLGIPVPGALPVTPIPRATPH